MAGTDQRSITILDYGAYVVLGLVCAVLGMAIMRLVTAAEGWVQKLTHSSPWRPVLGVCC
jgi:CIC family chloride channel protein